MPGAKSSMNSLDMHFMRRELSDVLTEAFLSKVYRPRRDVIVLRFNTKEHGRQDLLLHLGMRVHLARELPENPQTPDSFVTFVRKNMGNGRLKEIRQPNFDRIMEFVFRREAEWSLVFEMFRDGNLLVVQDGSIRFPLFKREYRHRSLSAGKRYELPPGGRTPLGAAPEEIKRVIAESETAGRGLAFGLNLGPRGAEEVLAEAGVEFNERTEFLDDADISGIVEAIPAVLERSMDPCIVYSEGTAVDFSPFPPAGAEEGDVKRFATFSEAVEEYFKNRAPAREDPALEALRRTARSQEERIEALEREAEEMTFAAEHIYQRYGDYQRVIEGVTGEAEKKGWQALSRSAGDGGIVKSVSPKDKTGVVRLDGDSPAVRIDFKLDVNGNASLLFEAAKKARSRIEGAKRALAETLERMENHVVEAEEKERSAGRRREWYQNYRWFITTEGNLVVAGRDAKSNERVVRKYLKDGDRYIHADLPGAPSTVVRKNGEGKISETALEQACAFAVLNSRAWKSGIGSAIAYWVTPEQVSRTPQPGEFLPKGAFIIRGKRNYSKKLEMRGAVGRGEIDGGVKVMFGPVEAVERWCDSYAVIVPGGMKKETLANKLSGAWNLPQEEVLSVLPPGGAKVVLAKGVDIPAESG